MIDVGTRWSVKYPDGPEIFVGDISVQGGGYIDGHQGHRDGRRVDIWPIHTNGRNEPLAWDDSTKYDQENIKATEDEHIGANLACRP